MGASTVAGEIPTLPNCNREGTGTDACPGVRSSTVLSQRFCTTLFYCLSRTKLLWQNTRATKVTRHRMTSRSARAILNIPVHIASKPTIEKPRRRGFLEST